MTIRIGSDQAAEVLNPYTYPEYLAMLEKLVMEKKTSGPEQSEEKINSTVINLQRMKRIFKDVTIDNELIKMIASFEQSLLWFVITEAWCGDAAQNLPVINKIAELSKNKIKLMLVLRDENPQLMNHFLTNGSKSIPKLVCVNAETMELIGSWGARPRPIQDVVDNYKKENPAATHKEVMYYLHLSYFHDKGQSLQGELIKMFEDCHEPILRHEIRQ